MQCSLCYVQILFIIWFCIHWQHNQTCAKVKLLSIKYNFMCHSPRCCSIFSPAKFPGYRAVFGIDHTGEVAVRRRSSIVLAFSIAAYPVCCQLRSKIGECYSIGQWHKNKYLQPICWKHLLCIEISVDVYAVCVFSGRVVNVPPKHTALYRSSLFYNFYINFYDFVLIENKYMSQINVVQSPVIEE